MPSVLNVDTIVDAAGTGPVTLTKQSAAKAWINMVGTGTIAVRDSLNIASITDIGVGTYQHNSTNVMSTDDFVCVFNAGNGAGNSDDSTNPGNGFSSSHVNTTSQTVNMAKNENASNGDRDYLGGIWQGDLA